MMGDNSKENIGGGMIRDLIGGRSAASDKIRYNPRSSTDFKGF